MDVDSYSFLAEYYALSEQTILDCVDYTQEIFEVLKHNEIAYLIEDRIKNNHTLSNLLKTMLVKVKYIECNKNTVHIKTYGKTPFFMQLNVEDDGTKYMTIRFDNIMIGVYKGIINDPFQEEPTIYLEFHVEKSSDEFLEQIYELRNGDTIDQLPDSIEHLLSPEIIVALSNRNLVDDIVNDFLDWGIYIKNQCR